MTRFILNSRERKHFLVKEDDAMPFCGNCGNKLPDGAKFCGVCGTPVKASAPEPKDLSTPDFQVEEQAQPAPVPQAPTPAPQPEQPKQVGGAPNPFSEAPATPTQPEVPATPAASQVPAQESASQAASQAETQAAYRASFLQNAASQTPPSQQGIPPVSFAQSAQNTMNQAQQAMPPQAQEFFTWLWQGFKTPSQSVSSQTWWPVAALVINAFLLALYPFVVGVQTTSALNGFTRGMTSSYGYSGYLPQANIPIGSLFKSWIVALAFFYLVILITYIGYRVMGDNTSFSALQQKVAQRFLPACGMSLIAILLTFLGPILAAVGGVCYAATYVLMAAAPGVWFAQAQSTRNLDRVWLWILASVIGGIVLLIFMVIVAGMGLSDAASGANSYLSSFGSLLHM